MSLETVIMSHVKQASHHYRFHHCHWGKWAPDISYQMN